MSQWGSAPREVDQPGWAILAEIVVENPACRRTPCPVPCLSGLCPSTITVTVPLPTCITPVSTSVNTAVTIAFSNTVRAERSEGRHRMTPLICLFSGHTCRGPVRQHAINPVFYCVLRENPLKCTAQSSISYIQR